MGSQLSHHLSGKGFRISHLSRRPVERTYPSFYWNIKKEKIEEKAIQKANVIIHLAGEGIAEKRWSKQRKKEIYESRIDSTRLLLEKVKAYNPQLKQFIAASAIGYYGLNTGKKWVNENSPKGEGFLTEVVEKWEKEVKRFEEIAIPYTIIRIGIVLDMKGGALPKIAKLFKLGLGAPLGSGKQYMSWIDTHDLCRLFTHTLENDLKGIYNGVSPAPITNKLFTKQMANAMNKPLLLPHIPAFGLKLLLGEMAKILIGGNRVSCQKIEKTGFHFHHRSPDITLKALMNASNANQKLSK